MRIVIPRLNAYFTGTGDLFAALSLARLESMEQDKHGVLKNKYTVKVMNNVFVKKITQLGYLWK